jgi:CheY-like chemotaxis protein
MMYSCVYSSVSKAIIDKLGGQVGAFSEGEGKGAMFYFELPCYEVIASNLFDNHEEPVQKSITTSHASPLNFPSVVPDALVDPLQEKAVVDENFPKSPIPQSSGKLIKEVDTNTKHSIATVIPQLELPPSIAAIQGTNVLRREGLGTSSDSADTPNSGSCQKSEESVLATESNTNLQHLEIIDRLEPLPQSKTSKPSIITNNSTLATPRSVFTKDSKEVLPSSKLQLQSPSSTNSTRGASFHSSDDCAISDGYNSNHIGNELKVLLADDAILSRKMVDRLLQPLHVNCIHASNGNEAVDAVIASLQQNEIPFDVIIIDYYMPEMDGPEAIKAMRQANFRGLICAVTGSTSATNHEKLLLNGANVIMSKPFNVKLFQQALRGRFC